TPIAISSAYHYENRVYYHLAFSSQESPVLEMEITLLSWRNHFTADVYGEHGSPHIESLCKWGPSSFIRRTRILPSGRPPEEAITLVQPDPTWAAEYEHFKGLCQDGSGAAGGLATDLRLNRLFAELARGADALEAS